MAEYKKRKDGRYGTKVTIGRDETGKYIRKGVYANTIRELKDKIRETKNLHDVVVPACKCTVKDHSKS